MLDRKLDAIRAGAIHFLAKPVRKEQLLLTISDILSSIGQRKFENKEVKKASKSFFSVIAKPWKLLSKKPKSQSNMARRIPSLGILF